VDSTPEEVVFDGVFIDFVKYTKKVLDQILASGHEKIRFIGKQTAF